jgi:hypothetical protein
MKNPRSKWLSDEHREKLREARCSQQISDPKALTESVVRQTTGVKALIELDVFFTVGLERTERISSPESTDA